VLPGEEGKVAGHFEEEPSPSHKRADCTVKGGGGNRGLRRERNCSSYLQRGKKGFLPRRRGTCPFWGRCCSFVGTGDGIAGKEGRDRVTRPLGVDDGRWARERQVTGRGRDVPVRGSSGSSTDFHRGEEKEDSRMLTEGAFGWEKRRGGSGKGFPDSKKKKPAGQRREKASRTGICLEGVVIFRGGGGKMKRGVVLTGRSGWSIFIRREGNSLTPGKRERSLIKKREKLEYRSEPYGFEKKSGVSKETKEPSERGLERAKATYLVHLHGKTDPIQCRKEKRPFSDDFTQPGRRRKPCRL